MIHVIPVSDSKPHFPLSTCDCGPRYNPEYDMIIHEAFEDEGQQWMSVMDGDFEFVRTEDDESDN